MSFGLIDQLEVHLDHVTMPASNGKTVKKTKGRYLHVWSSIKRSIFVVKALFSCLDHALIIAMAKVICDPKNAI